MKTQFTPGPWYVMTEKNGTHWVGNKKGENCCVQKNAALIAAAPELLEALGLLINMDVNGHSLIDRLQFSTKGREISDKIRAAIAKAKGE